MTSEAKLTMVSLDDYASLKNLLMTDRHVVDCECYYGLDTVYRLLGIPVDAERIRTELTRRIPERYVYRSIRFRNQETVTYGRAYAAPNAIWDLVDTIEEDQFDRRYPKAVWLSILPQLQRYEYPPTISGCVIL